MQTENHPIPQEELMAYLDGELGPARAAETAAHLETCVECRIFADDFGSVSEALRQWRVERPALSIDFSELHEEPGWKSLFVRWRPWMLVAGAAAALLFVASTQMVLQSPRRVTLADRAAMQEPIFRKGDDPRTSDSRQFLMGQRPIAPMIARTAEISLTTQEFEKTRISLDDILKRQGGYMASITVSAPEANARSVDATLSVPSDRLDASMAELRKLGRVLQESRHGTEVTQQYVDLQARLTNARNTEQRLKDLERKETGKLAEVLSVETEISRVRERIEQMEAETKNLSGRVLYSSIHVSIAEDYKSQLQIVPTSIGGRFRNAAIEGYRNAAEVLSSIVVFLLSYGPVLMLLAAILFWPVRLFWRRRLRRGIS